MHTEGKWLRGAAPVVVLAVLVLAQGGFFGIAPNLVGSVVCLVAAVGWLRAPRRAQRVPMTVPLLWCLALVYALSAAANGLTLTTLAETGSWAACAACALWTAGQDGRTHDQGLQLLCMLSCLTAVLGMAVYVGVVPLADGMTGTRLQMSFQYANAAGAWYAATALLCVQAPDARLRRLACLPALCLMLTQSMGSLVVFGALVAAYAARLVGGGDGGDGVCVARLAELLVQAVLAAASAALLSALPHPVTAVLVLALVVGWHGRGQALEAHLATLGPGRLAKACGIMVLVLAAGALVLLPGRLSQAAATLVERAWHVRDGVSLWARRPLLGVGPDNWKYLYRLVQSAPYRTSVVHCSYVQMLVDAGPLAPCLMLAVVACGLRGLAARGAADGWSRAQRSVLAFLALHAFVDFDLQFAALSYLLVWLATPPLEGADADALRPRPADVPAAVRLRPRGIASAALCLVLCLPLCVLGALSGLYGSSLQRAYAKGDTQGLQRLFESNPLAYADRSAQELFLASLFDAGDYERVTEAYETMHNPSDDCALVAARSLYALSRRREAALVLIERMEHQPYDADLRADAARLVAQEGLEPDLEDRYRAALGDEASSGW